MFDLVVFLIVLAPLAAALVNGINLLFGERLWNWRAVQRIASVAMLISFAGSAWVFAQVLIDPRPRQVEAYQWLASGGFSVPIAFLIDSLSALMMLVVTGFSFLIGMFSINYMHNDRSFSRYFSAMALFVFAMLILVMGNNFVMLFAGWELVGLCSYLLIGHYYDRKSAARAGTKAFVMNRVGDAGFLLGIFLMVANFGTVQYTEVFEAIKASDRGTATAIGLCLLMGAVGKSAQLPLGTWLARAMEGPTPSSALIHAATMVTAGVYLIVRSHAIYDMAPDALLAIAIIGAVTALYGALVGLTTSDIKGILASSTTTQLGLMFLACGLGAYSVAVFHLVAHAFLKSFLFLTAPSILHHIHVKADPTASERAEVPVPTHYWLVLVAAFAVMVVPFVLGLGSNELGGLSLSPVTVLIAGGVTSLFIALYYAMRMTRNAFAEHSEPVSHAADEPIGDAEHHAGAGYGKPILALVVVVACGLVAGLLPGGVDGGWFRELLNPILTVRPLAAGAEPILVYTLLGLLGIMLAVAWLTAIFFERFRPEMPGLAMLKGRRLYIAALHRFWIDEFYDRYLVRACKRLGLSLERFDVRVIDRIVGVPLPDSSSASVGGSVWEARFLAARAIGGKGTYATGVAGVTATSSIPTNLGDNPSFGRASGLPGWLTSTAASYSGAVERHLFGTAVNVGLPRVTDLFGQWLLRFESFIARPASVAVLLLAAIGLTLTVYGV